jgi:hypothetical protein
MDPIYLWRFDLPPEYHAVIIAPAAHVIIYYSFFIAQTRPHTTIFYLKDLREACLNRRLPLSLELGQGVLHPLLDLQKLVSRSRCWKRMTLQEAAAR